MKSGLKRFEMRRNDRNFAIGDSLMLKGFDRHAVKYTGDNVTVRVTYILPGDGIVLSTLYVIMSIEVIG